MPEFRPQLARRGAFRDKGRSHCQQADCAGSDLVTLWLLCEHRFGKVGKGRAAQEAHLYRIAEMHKTIENKG